MTAVNNTTDSIKHATKEVSMKELNINGAVVQTYPLTAAQRIHFYTVSACNRKELLSICTGFYLQYDQVDFDVLKECIYQGYEKYEAMRLRFHTDEEGQLYQYLVPTEDRDIPVVDFRDWKEDYCECQICYLHRFCLWRKL